MPWKKGESGNPDGLAPKKIWIAALNRAIAQDDGKKLRSAAEKLLALAADGDVAALKELGDRLDGKPAQAITGVDGGPLTIELVKFADTPPG